MAKLRVTMAEIKRVTARHFGVAPDDIDGEETRGQPLAARKAAF